MYIKIMKEDEQLYRHYKEYIPCFNGKCPVSMVCCKETKASRGAKHLRYTIHLKDHCKPATDILVAINSILPSIRRAKEELRECKEHLGKLETCVFYIRKFTQRLESLSVKNKKSTSNGKMKKK